MIPNDLHYLWPLGAFLLIGLIALGVFFWNLYSYRRKILSNFASPELLKIILVPRSTSNYWLKGCAICLAWFFATFALMQPLANGHYPLNGEPEPKQKIVDNDVIIQRKMHDVIFLFDASASMTVKDTRTHVSRFDCAKEIADTIISKLKGENIALYAFTSEPIKLAPPTMDYLYLRFMLKQMKINEGDLSGTDFLEAFKRIRNDFLGVITPVLKTLIIFSDGGDNPMEEIQGIKREKRIHSILEFLGDAQENKMQVYTIGLGSLEGQTIPGIESEGKPVLSFLEQGFLKQISGAAGGKYYFANNWSADNLAVNLVNAMNKQQSNIENYKIRQPNAGRKENQDLIYDLLFQFPLGAALICLAFALFFPETWEPRKE